MTNGIKQYTSLITCKMRQHFKTITAVGVERRLRSDALANG